jgi:hypothetical protein
MRLRSTHYGVTGGKLVLAMSFAAGLAACAGSERLPGAGSRPFGTAQARPAPEPELPRSEPVPTSRVESSTLAPPPGAAAGPATAAPDPLFEPTPQPAPQQAPTTPPPAPRQIETPTLSGGGREVATLGGGSAPSGRGAVSSRDGVIGSWTAREATGGSCRVTLSSSPALDLYRANASGCANRDLARVSAWDYRDGEVYLYQPGGTVAARMKVESGSLMGGVIARSGANVTLMR